MKIVNIDQEVDIEKILTELHNYRQNISQEVKRLNEEIKSK